MMYSTLREQIAGSISQKSGLEETISIYKKRSTPEPYPCTSLVSFGSRQRRMLTCRHAVEELETIRAELSAKNNDLHRMLENHKEHLAMTKLQLDEGRREHSIEVDDLGRKHRHTLEDLKTQGRRETERMRKDSQDEVERLLRVHREDLDAMERRLKSEIEDERSRRIREVQEISIQWALQRQAAEMEDERRGREAKRAKEEVQRVTADLEQEKRLNGHLKEKLSESSSNAISLEASITAMKAKIEFLESDSQTQSQAFQDIDQRMRDAIASAETANAKLRAEETLRRKLHNQVQELKGNIRVFCRVRPTLGGEEREAARIGYPDAEGESKEVSVEGPEQKSALGNVTSSGNSFSFDRVFGPSSQNRAVFEEISQLVQSALDGYNVCIFCYGQTGSGKTHTMSAADGMIPRAVRQIYATASALEEKGWRYEMEGSFVEVYNENLNDLLGGAEELDKRKHEIRHDASRKTTWITGVETVRLDTPDKVSSMLERASSKRSVAATKANERSSRSHSVFILRLRGENGVTGERSEGTLNLVDLAGSERLGHSGATGDRLKETQNINRSLSCLGDVIGALGQGKEGGHVPYRNSKVSASHRRTSPSTSKSSSGSSGGSSSSSTMVTRGDGDANADPSEPTVDLPPPILSGRELEDAHVRHDQSIAGASERDVDESEVRHKGK